MTAKKTCTKCKASKPLVEFYAHNKSKDGLFGKCKVCTRLDVRSNRAARAEYYRAYDRSRAMLPHRVGARAEYLKTDSGKAARRRAHANYFTKHPHRKRAVEAVNNAIRDGRLVKHPCFVCGAAAQAHHPDYSRPLDVVWLCVRHHREAHAIVSKEQAA